MSSNSQQLSGSSLRPPKYCRQRSRGRSDRAYVRIDGKKIMLGAYGSEESRLIYAELIGMPERPMPVKHGEQTVAQVMVAYLEHAQTYYKQPGGKLSREYEMIRDTLRFVKKNCSGLPAKEFGPKRLKEIREAMVAADHSRRYINKNIERIRRMFKWAAAEEMVPAGIHVALATVEGLKRGRCKARETKPVKPVAAVHVDSTLLHLPQVIADMVRLQLLTAMRAGELVQMRPRDIDRSGEVWVYRPESHKTAHHGHDRTVMIGPRAQAVLIPYLARGEDMHLFRPIDSEAKRQAEREAARRTPKSCGNTRGSNRVSDPRRKAGEYYTVDSYRRAIARACDKAFPAPADLEADALAQWQNEHRWSPHQLRHSAATEIRREFGLEAAQIILGHSQANVTQIYAERDMSKGCEVAKRIG